MNIKQQFTTVTRFSKIMALLIFVSFPFIGFYFGIQYDQAINSLSLSSMPDVVANKELQKPVACTLEAKICPDGSSVGRTEPNCGFATCPTTLDQTAGWQAYTNSTYHFTMQLPKDVYSSKCQQTQPVQIYETSNAIEIGARFNCPEKDQRFLNLLQGWKIYTSNNIDDVQAANTFVRNILGYTDCRVIEDKGELFILRTKEFEDNCTILTGKMSSMWSHKYGTWVFWDNNLHPEFETITGSNNDRHVGSSFAFN